MSDFKNLYTKRTGLRSQRNWANLPSVVLFEIYRLLPHNERLVVSSTCKQWREVFYAYPNWPYLDMLTFPPKSDEAPQKSQDFLRFVVKCNTVKKILIGFEDIDIIVEVMKILASENCLNISEVYFVSSTAIIERSKFSKSVYPFLKKCAHLKALFLYDFSCFQELIEILIKHEKTLIHVGIGKLHPEPKKRRSDVSSALLWALSELRQLQLLQIHAMWMTDEFLQGISDNLRNLKTLILFLDKSHPINKNVSEQSWEEFSRKMPDIEIRLIFFEVRIAESDVSSYIPKCVQNITVLRMIECDLCIPQTIMELAAEFRVKKLHTIWYISNPIALTPSRTLLPTVYLLPVKELVTAGYCYTMKHIVDVMTRYRSLNLQICLESIKIDSPMHQHDWFIDKMSEFGGKRWEPMNPERFFLPNMITEQWLYWALRVALISDLKLGIT